MAIAPDPSERAGPVGPGAAQAGRSARRRAERLRKSGPGVRTAAARRLCATWKSFNRDLNAYLDRLHRDNRESLEQTLRTGTQTLDNLFGRGHDPVERLRARIDEAVHDLYRGDEGGRAPPAVPAPGARDGNIPRSWSSRLHDCGFHTNHVHPKGWISSCYYVALPDAVADTDGKQGWIKFGEPAFDAGLEGPDPAHDPAQGRRAGAVPVLYVARHGAVPLPEPTAPPSPSTWCRAAAKPRYSPAIAFARIPR